ncbi:uncharacterized protein LOC135154441 [Lytechinus pictus]|uniref:uncharacterized protein LOC135154441 n=1 Tax=Lytechinus pictus TaxID=7653 RepID=UPI0030B9F789
MNLVPLIGLSEKLQVAELLAAGSLATEQSTLLFMLYVKTCSSSPTIDGSSVFFFSLNCQVSSMSSRAIVFVCILVAFVSITSARVIDTNGDQEAIDKTAMDLVNDDLTAHIPRAVKRSAGYMIGSPCCTSCNTGCYCCYA